MREITVALLLTPVLAMAGVDIDLDEPNYWTSTNNRIICRAEVTDGTLGITEARLRLNGQVVWTQVYGAIGPHPVYVPEITPSFMLDSTYWEHNTELEVKLEVKTTDSTTIYHSAQHTATIRNNFQAWANEEMTFNGEDELVTAFQEMNYSVVSFHEEWFFSQYFNFNSWANALEVHTHGNAGSHANGVEANTSGFDQIDWNDYVDLTDQISQPWELKIGTDLPPFNSTNKPPIHWFHLNACNCGDASGGEWARLLYPERNHYTLTTEDQALLAYKCWIIYGEHQTGTIALLSEFTSGNTVWRAVQALANSSMEVADSETGAPREVDIEDLVILGDSATRLTSVYNGNHKAGFGFLRVLSQG